MKVYIVTIVVNNRLCHCEVFKFAMDAEKHYFELLDRPDITGEVEVITTDKILNE